MPSRILLIEDDVLVRDLIALQLQNEGYEVMVAGSAKEMFQRLNEAPFDMLVLDLGLPDEDGITLARKIRANSAIPLIVLTARTELTDRLAVLDIGADDFLTKDVNSQEFLLRVRNLLIRSGNATGWSQINGKRILKFEGWVMDLDKYELRSPEDVEINLTAMEFNLLGVLVKGAGRVMSRQYLLDAISGIDEIPSERMIDAFISRIRKKLEPNQNDPSIIQTVTGVGYKFNARLEDNSNRRAR